MLYIGVIGANECTQKIYNIAEKVGSLIAEKSAVLVCGGRMGVMEALSKVANSSFGLLDKR